MSLRVWPGRDHNVVSCLRDDGELHALLQRHCAPGGPLAVAVAPA
jgi:hypothetical protein